VFLLYVFTKKNYCPKCKHNSVHKDGFKHDKQQYQCNNCNCRFILKNHAWVELAYIDYTIHKQSYAELEIKYGKNEKTIRKYFDKLAIPKRFKETLNIAICLTMDTTFFKGVDGFGVVDLRAESKHIYWEYCQSERLSEYAKALSFVDTKYELKSVTIDGKRGLRELIEKRYSYTVPVQYCHFHQVATITRYTTKNPKTDCGKGLRSLILKLKDLNYSDFNQQFENLKIEHKDFLKEKNEQGNFSHQNLRKAVRSIQSNLGHLFTFESYPNLNIPKTTNSCDGNFGQWKRKIKLHNSLSKARKMKMINEFLGYENKSV